jgi:hypothetical protein
MNRRDFLGRLAAAAHIFHVRMLPVVSGGLMLDSLRERCQPPTGYNLCVREHSLSKDGTRLYAKFVFAE